MDRQINQLGHRVVVRVCLIALLLLIVALLGGGQSTKLSALENRPQVIGGEEAVPGQWPWMVALVHAPIQNAHLGQFCGGTLVSPQWVLTAAHCTQGLTASRIHVVLGRHNLTSNEGERLAVTEIRVHPAFNPNTLDSDLALLRLERPSVQQTIPVATPEMVEMLAYPGSIATVTGWGNTNLFIPHYPETLQQAQLPVVEREVCNSPTAYNGGVTTNMLCAGYDEGGLDSCKGDSGGPLMIAQEEDGNWVQVGVVSWGEGCAQMYRYGVYTQLANFADWIATNAVEPVAQLWLPAIMTP